MSSSLFVPVSKRTAVLFGDELVPFDSLLTRARDVSMVNIRGIAYLLKQGEQNEEL